MSKFKFVCWLLIPVLFACGAAAVAWRNGLFDRRYTATARLLLDRPEPDVHDGHEIPLDTEMTLLKCRFVLQAAMRDPRVKNQACIKGKDAHNAMEWLAKELCVKSTDRQAGVFTVSLTSSDPNEAAALVNAVVDAYLKEAIDNDRQFRQDSLREVEQWIAEEEKGARAVREQLKRKGENTSPSSDSQEARTELEKAERVLRYQVEQRERLRIELKAGPRVRVLGDSNSPAAVPKRPD